MDEKSIRLIQIIKNAKAKYADESFILPVPGFLSRSFTSFCSMREDLILIRQYLKYLKSNTDNIINSSMTYSAISLYGKCFTDATKNKAPKLEPIQLFDKQEDLRQTHEYLMDLRHHFISHRGDTDSEVEAAYILIPKGNGSSQVKYSRLKKMSFESDQIEKIDELMEYLLQQLEKKIQKSGQKAYEAILKNFTAEQMALMTINNIKEDE